MSKNLNRALNFGVAIALVAAAVVLWPTVDAVAQTAIRLFGTLSSGASRAVLVNSDGSMNVSLSGGGTSTSAISVDIPGIAAGPATAPNTAIGCLNSTAATVSVTAQWSPGCPVWTAPAWDTDDAVSRTTHMYLTLQPITGNTVTSQLVLQAEASPFAGSYNTAMRVSNGGQATFLGSVVAGTSSGFVVLNKSVMQSGTDGLMVFSKNAGNAAPAVEMNMGTAVPTVANCSVGTAGAVLAHSTNTAGAVTPGSGSTACDVVFGAPGYSFAPFCVITDYTSVILAPRISARATTGFTVTGLTAGDTFGYICLGGT